MRPLGKRRVLPVALAVLFAGLVCVFTGQRNTANASLIHTPFVLHCSKIIGTNAHLNALAGQLMFDSATLQGVTISRSLSGEQQLVLSTDRTVQATHVTIQTSLLDAKNIASAIGMFLQSPEDLTTLLLGGTVHQLILNNVTLNIDGYLNADSLTLPNLQVQLR